MALYPHAERHTPWRGPAVYLGNQPIAVVIHVGQGWLRTWDGWAASGYEGASFHFGVGLDGRVHQYLDTALGGAHAGVVAKATAAILPRLLPHVNLRTVGVEHEGFSSGLTPEGRPTGQWNDAQIESSARLVRWTCEAHGIPPDREHILGHYEIDGVNRRNDPGPLFPWERYIDLVQGGDDMSEEDRARLARLERLVGGNGYARSEDGPPLTGEEALRAADEDGHSLLLALANTQRALGSHIATSEAERVREDLVVALRAAAETIARREAPD